MQEENKLMQEQLTEARNESGTLAEEAEAPIFPGKPRDHAGLNRTEVRDDKPVAYAGHERGAHQLTERVRH